MNPLFVDPLGVVSLVKELFSAGDQWRVSWSKDRRVLKKIEDFMRYDGKLSNQERRRTLKALKSDSQLRQYILRPKQTGDLQKYLLLLNIDEPAFGKIAEPLCQLVEKLAFEEHASTIEGLTNERILKQGDVQDETLTIVREMREPLRKQREIENNPLGSMKNIAHDKFRGYNIRAISISPDTRESQIVFDKPFEISLEGSGPTAHRLQKFAEKVLAGEIASLEFTPEDDFRVSVNPPVMEKLISLNFTKIEVKPTPQVVEQVIRCTVGDFSRAINTQIIYDRAARRTTLKLKTQQPSLKFQISWSDESKKSTFTISMSLEDGQRPSLSDLSILHLVSRLNDKRAILDLINENSGERFASMDLSSSHPYENFVQLSYLAYFMALYLEANYELRRAQIIDTDLPWPDDGDWNDPEMKLINLLERIRDVLKNGNATSSVSGKATLVEIYDDAPDADIEDGILKGNATLSEPVSFGEHSKFTQSFTFDNPRIKLWQDNKELKAKSIREAFETYGGPITLELQDDQAVTTFAKKD